MIDMPRRRPTPPASSNARWLIVDVDGVLTDGSIWIGPKGEEYKKFNVRDGQGIVAWRQLGGRVAIVSGRSSPAVKHRARELKIDAVYQGVKDKGKALEKLAREHGVSFETAAYIGDDTADLPAMRLVGYAIAVADAQSEVLRAATFVTTRRGGEGAVREAIEHLIRRGGPAAGPA